MQLFNGVNYKITFLTSGTVTQVARIANLYMIFIQISVK